ncbi:MAG TPA: type II secretion system major pseudopilin GspG [Phycisphaerales bacterium]|nr:type II secretion system major pseudopilin GspG [Phycisphaerales bacterium]
MRTQRSARVGAGFTLLEVMIVVVIILAIAGLVTVNLMGSKQQATRNIAKTNMQTLKQGLNSFYIDFERYPTDEEGLAVLWSKTNLPEDLHAKWRPYLDEPMPTDPWDQPWGYRQQGEEAPEGKFDLWSNGPDQQEGTEDDLKLWKAAEGQDDPGSLPPPPPRGGN